MAPDNPLHNAGFRRLFTAQVISLVGSGLSTVALTLLAFDIAGSNAALVLGSALAIKMVAYVVFAPVAGGLAHRFRRRQLLVVLNLLRAAIIVCLPLVDAVWQIYLLIFLLNLFAAGFTPVFAATVPDILPDEGSYTRALSMSRLAYDLESLLSPMLAAVALLYLSYSGLFVLNAVAFVLAAALVGSASLPVAQAVARQGRIWDEISFGVRAYLKTPRLRGLLALYLGVAAASAMVIVNTVVYVREALAGSESDVALALAAAGFGSMLAALGLPRLLRHVTDRTVVLAGSLVMAGGLGLMAGGPSQAMLWPVWFLVGLGWSLVQTPAGRLVSRSAAPSDRSAYFSAQFALSHACWMLFYPLAGYAGTWLGFEATAMLLAAVVLASTLLAAALWPSRDEQVLAHSHPETLHVHLHTHDTHHDHAHEGWEGPEPHSHPHRHAPVRHAHAFFIDDHHSVWPGRP